MFILLLQMFLLQLLHETGSCLDGLEAPFKSIILKEFHETICETTHNIFKETLLLFLPDFPINISELVEWGGGAGFNVICLGLVCI